MDEPILDKKAQDAVIAATDAAHAVEVVRQQQLDTAATNAAHLAAELATERMAESLSSKIIDQQAIGAMLSRSEERLSKTVEDVMERKFAFAFTTPEGARRKFIDITQMDRICDDITEQKEISKDIQKDIADINESKVTKTDFLLLKQRSDETNGIVRYAVGFIVIAFLGALTALVFK